MECPCGRHRTHIAWSSHANAQSRVDAVLLELQNTHVMSSVYFGIISINHCPVEQDPVDYGTCNHQRAMLCARCHVHGGSHMTIDSWGGGVYFRSKIVMISGTPPAICPVLVYSHLCFIICIVRYVDLDDGTCVGWTFECCKPTASVPVYRCC